MSIAGKSFCPHCSHFLSNFAFPSQYSPFTMSNPARSTQNSRSHLSTDFDWEMLPSVGDQTKFTTASCESPPMSSDHKEHIKDKKSTPGAIPKNPTASDLPQAATPDVSAGLAFANTPPSKASFPRNELTRLQILKNTQSYRSRNWSYNYS